MTIAREVVILESHINAYEISQQYIIHHRYIIQDTPCTIYHIPYLANVLCSFQSHLVSVYEEMK